MSADTAVLEAQAAAPRSPLAAIAALPTWAILLTAAVLVRALTFGNPVVHVDEEFYFATARMMLNGALPFVDVWDRKPIGLFLLYLPAAAAGVPAGIWVYQAMALTCVVLTSLLILRLAKRAGWERGALTAALLYVFMINFGDGQGGQAPVFYNLITAFAIALVLPCTTDADSQRRRRAKAVAAMGLIGVALQIKYSVLFEGMFLGLWLLWRERRLGVQLPEIIGFGGLLVAAAMAPTAFAWGAYAAMGHSDAWLYANFGSIFMRQSDPGDVLLRAFLKVALMLGPLLIVSGLSRHVPVNDESEHPVRALLFGWLVASVFGLLVFGSWFNHYALPVMLPAALCCAGYLGGHRIGRIWLTPLMLAAAAFGGEYTAWSAMWHRGNAQQLDQLADAIGRGPGCMYVYSGNAILYSYTGRCTLTPWVFPSHLSRERENGALGVDQLDEINRIFAKHPQIVVMRPTYFGERMAAHRLTVHKLAEGGYTLRGRYPLGDIWIAVYAAPASEARVPRRSASRPS